MNPDPKDETRTYRDMIAVAHRNRSFDALMLVLHVASNAHSRREITDKQMANLLEEGINVAADLNGYTDKYGKPL